MDLPRFRVAGLMAVVGLAGVGTAALSRVNDWWASGVLSASLAILTTALIAAIVARGPSRAFATGMSLAGWGYVALVFIPGLDEAIGSHLITSHSLALLYPQLHPAEETTDQVDDALILSTGRQLLIVDAAGNPTFSTGPVRVGPRPRPAAETSSAFRTTGHSLYALVVAMAGGLIGRKFSPADGPDRPPRPERPPGASP